MLFGSASSELVDAIKAGRGVHDSATFVALKNAAKAWKPSGYDDHQVMLRHYYEGRIEEHLRAFAQQRFPNSAHRMPITPFNWARVFAENGAAVYDYAPQRYVERDGVRIETSNPTDDNDSVDVDADDRQRAIDFASMVREAHLEVVMAEAERRLVLARTMFLRVHSDSTTSKATGAPPRTVVTPFWPSDVLVIPHPRCPTSLATCVALLVRVSGDDGVQGTSTTWEVWTRSWTDDEDGEVESFGKWRAEIVDERATVNGKGEVTSVDASTRVLKWRSPDSTIASEEYPLPTLPFVAWHGGVADGCPFLDVDRNLVGLFDTINATLMSEMFAVDMNSATPMIRFSDDVAPRTLALGPGMMPTLPRLDTVTAVPLGADFQGIRNAARGLQANLAITHRQRSEGYDVDAASVAISGVALKIKNEPQTKARLEAIARAREVESRLLAVMIEVHDFFRGTSIASPGVAGVMDPRDLPEYEDATERQKRAIDAEAAGLIDRIEARVASGWSRTQEEAIAALAKIEAKASMRPNGLRAALDDVDEDPVMVPPGTIAPDVAAVADTALNGAQVKSLMEIVQAVSPGPLPKASGEAIIAAAFPAIKADAVKAIMGPLDEGSAEPAPQPFGVRGG